MSQFFVNLLLVTLLFLNNNIDVAAQDKLKFGLNAPYNNPAFYKIVPDAGSYADFFNDYHVQYLRFPGGSVVRFFIYNSSSLTNQAKAKVFDYYRSRGKERALDKPEDEDQNFNFPDNYYESFLKFCVNNKVKPIITLNTCFYAYNNTIYQVAPFLHTNKQERAKNKGDNKNAADEFNDNGLNDKLEKTLTDQINLTHKYFKKVTWEIGNEENYMHSAEAEADIVKFYISVIKSLYPEDEIIASFVNTYGESKQTGASKNNKDKYAGEFINRLNQMNLLPQIDYFAPHFYVSVHEQIKTEQDIQKRFQDLDFAGFEKNELSYFPNGYKPHFFITEFAAFLGVPSTNPNYNSSLHALMLFDFLINFYGSNSIDGIIYHSFLGKAPFIFIQQDAKAFNNNIVNKNSGYKNIGVIPIQAQAVQLFYKNVGEKYIKLVHDGNLTILVTQSGGRYIYFIINTSPNDATIDRKKIVEALQDDTELSFTAYSFQDLNSKNNVPVSQVTKNRSKDFTSMDVKKYSVLIIK